MTVFNAAACTEKAEIPNKSDPPNISKTKGISSNLLHQKDVNVCIGIISVTLQLQKLSALNNFLLKPQIKTLSNNSLVTDTTSEGKSESCSFLIRLFSEEKLISVSHDGCPPLLRWCTKMVQRHHKKQALPSSNPPGVAVCQFKLSPSAKKAVGTLLQPATRGRTGFQVFTFCFAGKSQKPGDDSKDWTHRG